MTTGQWGRILFDVMSHTVAGDFGIGDHGQEGIDTFLDQYQCQRMCETLQMEIKDGSEGGAGDE